MKKWAIAACVYLVVIIAGNMVYDKFFNHDSVDPEAIAMNDHGMNMGNEHAGAVSKTCEIKPEFTYQDGKITIVLKYQNGKLVNDLQVNHEKLMHLIVVDDQLNQYYHLHPKKVGNRVFVVSHTLTDGAYKAFVDIQSKALNYEVKPLNFKVGNTKEPRIPIKLQTDRKFVKNIDGKRVELKINTFQAGKPVRLNFTLNESTLEPYLGAAGHVVILNEQGTKYLHVHPTDESKPIFDTQFSQPGIYKIWAEFKQSGKVRVFPFVIEIK